MSVDTKALWKLTYGLYLITSCKDGEINGQIANTVIQVSGKPPRIAVSINKECYTHSFIQRSKTFAVSVLEQDTPMEFIGRFGFRCGKTFDKFENISFEKGETGCPLVEQHSVAIMDARVIRQADAGTHTVFIADVVSSKVINDHEPLTYAYYQNVKKGKADKKAPTYKGDDTTKSNEGGGMEKYVCNVCGYVYDPEKGDPENGVNPGTKFEDVPDSWVCPVCGVGKDQFKKAD